MLKELKYAFTTDIIRSNQANYESGNWKLNAALISKVSQ